jgi:hypothetical protein
MEDYLLNGRIKSKPIYFCRYRMFKRIIRRFCHVLKMTVFSVLVFGGPNFEFLKFSLRYFMYTWQASLVIFWYAKNGDGVRLHTIFIGV